MTEREYKALLSALARVSPSLRRRCQPALYSKLVFDGHAARRGDAAYEDYGHQFCRDFDSVEQRRLCKHITEVKINHWPEEGPDEDGGGPFTPPSLVHFYTCLVKRAARFSGLRSLTFANTVLDNDALLAIVAMPQLREVVLSGWSHSPGDPEFLALPDNPPQMITSLIVKSVQASEFPELVARMVDKPRLRTFVTCTYLACGRCFRAMWRCPCSRSSAAPSIRC